MKSMAKRVISLICAVSVTVSVLSSVAFAATPADLKAKIDSYGNVDFKTGDISEWQSRVDEVLGMYGALSDEDKTGVDEADLAVINGYEEFTANRDDYVRAYGIYAEINKILDTYEGLTPDEKDEAAHKQELFAGLKRINKEIENDDGSNLKVLEILGRYNYGRFESSYDNYTKKFNGEALNILTGNMLKLAEILGDGAEFEKNGVNIKDEKYLEVRKYITNIAASYGKLCDEQRTYLNDGFEKGLYDTEDYFNGKEDYAKLAIAPEKYINYVSDAEKAFVPGKEKYFSEKIAELETFRNSEIKLAEAEALNAEYSALNGKVNTATERLFDSSKAIFDKIAELCDFNKVMKDFADKVNEISTIEFSSANYSADMGKMDAADALYNAMSAEQQSNAAVADCKKTLDEKRAAFEAAGKAAVDETIKAIDAIGAVEYTLEALERVEAARAKYDALDAFLQGEVTNSRVLTDAEEDIKDYKAARKADDLIAAIGNTGDLATDDIVLTDACKAKIVAARTAYDELTDVQRGLSEKYAKLTEAENDYKTLEAGRDKILAYTDAVKVDRDTFEKAYGYTSTAKFDDVFVNYSALKSFFDGLSYKSKLDSFMKDAREAVGAVEQFKAELDKLNAKCAALNNGYTDWFDKYKEYSENGNTVKYSDYASHKEYLSEAIAQLANGDINSAIMQHFIGIFNAMSDIAADYKAELDVYESLKYTVDYAAEPYKTGKANYDDFDAAVKAFRELYSSYEQAFENVDAWAAKVAELNEMVSAADGKLKETAKLSDFVEGVRAVDEEYNGFDESELAYVKYQKDSEFNRYKYLVALSSYYEAGYEYVYGNDTFTGTEKYYGMEYSEVGDETNALAELYESLPQIVKSIDEVKEGNRKYNAMAWGVEAYKLLTGENITPAAIYNLEDLYNQSGYYKDYDRASSKYEELQAKETEIIIGMIEKLSYSSYETDVPAINDAYSKLDDNQKANVKNYNKVVYTEKTTDIAKNLLLSSAAGFGIDEADERANAIEEILKAYYGEEKENAALAFEILENKKALDDLQAAVVYLIDSKIENDLPAYTDIEALDITAGDFVDSAKAYSDIIDSIAKLYNYFETRKENADTDEIKKLYNKMSIDAKLAVTKYSKYELCKNILAAKIKEYNSYKANEVISAVNTVRSTNITAANYENMLAEIADCRNKYAALTDEQKALVDANYDKDEAQGCPKPLTDAEAECELYKAARLEADEIIAKANEVMNTYSSITKDNYKAAKAAAQEVRDAIAGASARAKEFDLESYDAEMQKLIESTGDIEVYMSVAELIEKLKDELYDSIVNDGAINSEYGVRIAEAEAAYNALSDENKLKVENYSSLKVMRDAYNQNVTAAIDETKAAIDAIPAVDEIKKPEDGKAIAAALEKFDSLSDENKAKLGDEYIKKLSDAKAKYDSLYDTADVEAMIEKLEDPTTVVITAANIDAIRKDAEAARKAYDSLRNEQKLEVKNYSKLTLLEQKIGEFAKKPGDANNDGKVDIFDILDMVDVALERKTFEAEAFERCNLVKGDGAEPEVIDIFDILEVLKLVEF